MLVIAALQRFYCNSIHLGSNPPKHPYHGTLMFRGIPSLLLQQRNQIISQRCSLCCALSEEETQHPAGLSVLIYIHSGFSMSHFKEEKNWDGKLEEERAKAVAFVHSLSGDTACSVERKLREIALLPFKHSEYILNIKTDFSSNIFLSPGKINVVWFGTLVILLVNASILFRYWQTSHVWMKGL